MCFYKIYNLLLHKMERPFYFNGGSVYFVFKVELKYEFYQMIGDVNQQNQLWVSRPQQHQNWTTIQRRAETGNISTIQLPYTICTSTRSACTGTRVPEDSNGDAQASHCLQFSQQKCLWCRRGNHRQTKIKQKQKKLVHFKYGPSFIPAHCKGSTRCLKQS